MNTLRVSSIAFGMLCGITGVVAGIFLILQGNEPKNKPIMNLQRG
jgi:hypothetical protein